MITIAIVLVLLYTLFQAMPGDPASMMINPQMDANAIRTIEEMYGLNDPWYVQFGNYVRNMAGYPLDSGIDGDDYISDHFGYSFSGSRPMVRAITP